MKKILLTLLLLSISNFCISQSNKTKISENYSLANFIKDSFDYKIAHNFECKWEVCIVLIRLNKKREIVDLSFSDSISLSLKNELQRILFLSNGLWEKNYIKKLGSSNYLLLPVLKTFISNCNDTNEYKIKYRGIDSNLENELYLWKSVSINSSGYLSNIVMNYENLLNIGNENRKYLNCVILPPCVLRDREPKNIRKL